MNNTDKHHGQGGFYTQVDDGPRQLVERTDMPKQPDTEPVPSAQTKPVKPRKVKGTHDAV